MPQLSAPIRIDRSRAKGAVSIYSPGASSFLPSFFSHIFPIGVM